MCGIVGGIALENGGAPNFEVVQAMCDSLTHRGPDGEGLLTSMQFELNNAKNVQEIKSDRNLWLGHRRLSIIDLSTDASQPMVDTSGKYAIVFNGEIYNHAKLRKELESKGVRFKTSHSDTEVLLNGLIFEGKNFLDKVNGMFAFCFMDTANDYFLFARDRLGIKPFYYSVINGVFYFASEVKALRKVPGFISEIDETALLDYFVFSSVKAPRTIYKNTSKLCPGHLIEMKAGRIGSERPFWDLKAISKRKTNLQSETDALLNYFDQSAQRRMIADVEVGVLLSGGVDSTANLGMLTKHSNQPISAFSIGFKPEPGYQNEFKFARIAANHFGADYHEIQVSYEDFIRDLSESIGFQDMPIADSANALIYRIARTAKEKGITVLLGGEGSDELMIGYSYWSFASKYQKLLKESKSKTRLVSSIHQLPLINKKRAIYKNWYRKTLDGYTHFSGGTETRSVELARSLLDPDAQRRVKDYNPLDQIQQMYKDFMQNDEFDYFDWMTYMDLNHRLPELLLARLDRMTMGASVEGRVPFLDHELAEFCFSMPNEFKFQNGIEKYLLKKSFEGIVPNEILYRPKEGFLLPLNEIINSKKTEMNRLLSEARQRFGLINENASIEASNSGHQNYNLFNMAIWMNEHEN